jgi:hypothetical protein
VSNPFGRAFESISWPRNYIFSLCHSLRFVPFDCRAPSREFKRLELLYQRAFVLLTGVDPPSCPTRPAATEQSYHDFPKYDLGHK